MSNHHIPEYSSWVFICTPTQSSVTEEGINGEVRHQRGERSSNLSKAPPGQDMGSVERCAVGEGRGAQTVSLDTGGGLDPHRRRGEGTVNHITGEGTGARTTPLDRRGGLDPRLRREDVRSKRTTVRK
jgi:hypothetical protein